MSSDPLAPPVLRLTLTRDPLADAGDCPAASAVESHAPQLSLSVIHGSMASADAPVMSGCYAYESLRGSMSFLDRLLAGKLQEIHALGRFPQRPDSALVVLQPDAARRPGGAIGQPARAAFLALYHDAVRRHGSIGEPEAIMLPLHFLLELLPPDSAQTGLRSAVQALASQLQSSLPAISRAPLRNGAHSARPDSPAASS
ncbi:hypothetical protein CNX70_12350 [Janthinobacterium svalbardensis]|uniref:Uncharacterized protein n=1 Tax=Janthinobacterium svalbardensis TaxID=368607 RepID=A0A290WVG0_9BURK|nr:hypothetical protein [Janthinobacterium svalbardensis]ATD60864.1 hypothetical protein CNX70_12350 [Janthinobacterium svalbardensis]